MNEWLIEFTAPCKPWSTNERLHWAESSRRVKSFRSAACKAASCQVDGELPPCTVEISIPFERKARRDPSNYVGTVLKATVDGLGPEVCRLNKKGELMLSPGAGLWPDDNPTWVTIVEPVLAIRKDGLVVVSLKER